MRQNNHKSNRDRNQRRGAWGYFNRFVFLIALAALFLRDKNSGELDNTSIHDGTEGDASPSRLSMLPAINLNFPVAAAETVGMKVDPTAAFGKDKYNTKPNILERVQEKIKFGAGFNDQEEKRLHNLIGEATEQWLRLDNEPNEDKPSGWAWCTLSMFAYENHPLHVFSRRATERELRSYKTVINGRRLLLESDHGGNILAPFAFAFMKIRENVWRLPDHVFYDHPTSSNCSFLRLTEEDKGGLQRGEAVVFERLQLLYNLRFHEESFADVKAFQSFRPYFWELPSEPGEQPSQTRTVKYSRLRVTLSLVVPQEFSEYSLYFPLELNYSLASRPLDTALNVKAFVNLYILGKSHYNDSTWQEQLIYFQTLLSILPVEIRNILRELKQFPAMAEESFYGYAREIFFSTSFIGNSVWGAIAGSTYGFAGGNWRHPWWLVKLLAIIRVVIDVEKFSSSHNRQNMAGYLVFFIVGIISPGLLRFLPVCLSREHKAIEQKAATTSGQTPRAKVKKAKSKEKPPRPVNDTEIKQDKPPPPVRSDKPLHAKVSELLRMIEEVIDAWAETNSKLSDLERSDRELWEEQKKEVQQLIHQELAEPLNNLLGELRDHQLTDFNLNFDGDHAGWIKYHWKLKQWLVLDRNQRNESDLEPLTLPESCDQYFESFRGGLVSLKTILKNTEAMVRNIGKSNKSKREYEVVDKIHQRQTGRYKENKERKNIAPKPNRDHKPEQQTTSPVLIISVPAQEESSSSSSSSFDSRRRLDQASTQSGSESDRPVGEYKKRRPADPVLADFVSVAFLNKDLQKMQVNLKKLQSNLETILSVEVEGEEEPVKINAIGLMLIWINELFPSYVQKHRTEAVVMQLNTLKNILGSIRLGVAKIHHHLLVDRSDSKQDEDKRQSSSCQAMCQLGQHALNILKQIQNEQPSAGELKNCFDAISNNSIYEKLVTLSACDNVSHNPQQLNAAFELAAKQFNSVFIEKCYDTSNASREHMWQASGIFSVVIWNPLRMNMIKAGMMGVEKFNSVLADIGKELSNEARHEWQTNVDGYVKKILDTLQSAQIERVERAPTLQNFSV